LKRTAELDRQLVSVGQRADVAIRQPVNELEAELSRPAHGSLSVVHRA
jgi:hypothetical protein